MGPQPGPSPGSAPTPDSPKQEDADASPAARDGDDGQAGVPSEDASGPEAALPGGSRPGPGPPTRKSHFGKKFASLATGQDQAGAPLSGPTEARGTSDDSAVPSGLRSAPGGCCPPTRDPPDTGRGAEEPRPGLMTAPLSERARVCHSAIMAANEVMAGAGNSSRRIRRNSAPEPPGSQNRLHGPGEARAHAHRGEGTPSSRGRSQTGNARAPQHQAPSFPGATRVSFLTRAAGEGGAGGASCPRLRRTRKGRRVRGRAGPTQREPNTAHPSQDPRCPWGPEPGPPACEPAPTAPGAGTDAGCLCAHPQETARRGLRRGARGAECGAAAEGWGRSCRDSPRPSAPGTGPVTPVESHR